MSLILFSAPELHLKGLESVYTDFVICQHRWTQFITCLQDEWTGFTLYGAVLLIANVAFLTIPSVDPGNRACTPAQLASYLSIITSIGSIVTGLLLLRQHRTKPQDAAGEVDNYLRSRHHDALGFETLAILYSLPYSLLLWSMMIFTTAFSIGIFMSSHPTWVKLPLGIVLALVILPVSWCFLATVETGAGLSIPNKVHIWKDRLLKFIGGVPEPVPDAGNCEGEGGKLRRFGTLKETFKFIRRPRRQRASTFSTLVDPNLTGDDGACGSGVINKKEQGSMV